MAYLMKKKQQGSEGANRIELKQAEPEFKAQEYGRKREKTIRYLAFDIKHYLY